MRKRDLERLKRRIHNVVDKMIASEVWTVELIESVTVKDHYEPRGYSYVTEFAFLSTNGEIICDQSNGYSYPISFYEPEEIRAICKEVTRTLNEDNRSRKTY